MCRHFVIKQFEALVYRYTGPITLAPRYVVDKNRHKDLKLPTLDGLVETRYNQIYSRLYHALSPSDLLIENPPLPPVAIGGVSRISFRDRFRSLIYFI